MRGSVPATIREGRRRAGARPAPSSAQQQQLQLQPQQEEQQGAGRDEERADRREEGGLHSLRAVGNELVGREEEADGGRSLMECSAAGGGAWVGPGGGTAGCLQT